MKCNLTNQKLSDATDSANAVTRKDPLYKIGDMLQKRNDSSCFGRVIYKSNLNGQWVYRLMGSDTKPAEVEENELEFRLN